MASESTWEAQKFQTFLGNDALDWPILVSVFYTEVHTNVVCHCVLWHWLCSGYVSDTQLFATGMLLNPQLW